MSNPGQSYKINTYLCWLTENATGIFHVKETQDSMSQYIVSATEFSVPDKECVMTQPDDPCQMFAKMAFPVNEFNPPSITCAKKL